MAGDTAAVLRALGVDAADLAGYSMSGGVALQLAVRGPAVSADLAGILPVSFLAMWGLFAY